MAFNRFTVKLLEAIQTVAESANEIANKIEGTEEEKRELFEQYIEKEIAKMKDNTQETLFQSRFKTIIKNKCCELFGKPSKGLDGVGETFEEDAQIETDLTPPEKKVKAVKKRAITTKVAEM
jgi:hypothetical protein